jgi:hypothetical protein
MATIYLSTVDDYDGNTVPFPASEAPDMGAKELHSLSCAGAVASASSTAGVLPTLMTLIGEHISESSVVGGLFATFTLLGGSVSASSSVTAMTEIEWPGFLGGSRRLLMDMGMA